MSTQHKEEIIALLKNPILSIDKIAPSILKDIEEADEAVLLATIELLQKIIQEKQENMRAAQGEAEAALRSLKQ